MKPRTSQSESHSPSKLGSTAASSQLAGFFGQLPAKRSYAEFAEVGHGKPRAAAN